MKPQRNAFLGAYFLVSILFMTAHLVIWAGQILRFAFLSLTQ